MAKALKEKPPQRGRVTVIGQGFVGLSTAALLAGSGWKVVGVDVVPAIVDSINAGKSPVAEAPLQALVEQGVASGLLRAGAAVEPADVYLITIPFVLAGEMAQGISKNLVDVLRTVAARLEKGNLVVIETTCPPGSTEAAVRLLREYRPDLRFPIGPDDAPEVHVAHCPERSMPGQLIAEMSSNARVIGGVSRACARAARDFYETIVVGRCFETSSRVSELVKLAENSFRDMNLAFANELSMICDRMGLDPWEVVELANEHPRVKILRPGPGVGGPCLSFSSEVLIGQFPSDTSFLRAGREVNRRKVDHVVARIKTEAALVPGAVIACLGLTYRAGVADVRASPAMEIVRRLASEGTYELWAVEPRITTLPSDLESRGVTLASLGEALERAGLIVLLVDHSEFGALSLSQLRGKRIIDTRGAWRK